MSKHTPGPWVVNPLQIDQICTADARSAVAFAIARSSVDQTIANASLLAAAPDLLEALQAIAALPEHPMRKRGVEIARAAIAKATGAA